MSKKSNIETVSVVVPMNPFKPADLASVRHCLCALDVEKLMEWWPGLAHTPHRDPTKVKAIQRSLDWKRVVQIAAYLLQREIEDAPTLMDEVFGPIYEPKKNEPGREWPPRTRGVVKYAKSSFPFLSNVLVHVNGAKLSNKVDVEGVAELGLDPSAKDFYLTVIDGQHRVNGAYLALKLLQKANPKEQFELPTEVFLDLDPAKSPPVRQAQIFIDVNLNQKKVDRSLVDDLFPTARGDRGPLDRKERSQDIGRKLMLEVGPLVGMIQIPGIRYGVKDVVTLATLNSAIEGTIPAMESCEITNLEAQISFLAEILECWLAASGRAEEQATELNPQNVVYQGRILVSIMDLVPAILVHLKRKKIPFVSEKAGAEITTWLHHAIERAGLLTDGKFIAKEEFKGSGFTGNGGIARFRNTLWAAAFSKKKLPKLKPEAIAEKANGARAEVNKTINAD
jgi:DGQHR domain-containing protein